MQAEGAAGAGHLLRDLLSSLMRIWRRLLGYQRMPSSSRHDESASGSWSPAGIQQFHYLLLKKCDRLGMRSEPGRNPIAFQRKDRCVDECFSWGGLGGLRDWSAPSLSNIGVVVLPDQKAIGSAYQAFDENENLKDESQQAAIMQLGSKPQPWLPNWIPDLTHHRDVKFGYAISYQIVW